MHPITALMLSQAQEADRRRELSRRRHHRVFDESRAEPPKRQSWIERIRLPRLGLSSS
jgi:hypothetical protein